MIHFAGQSVESVYEVMNEDKGEDVNEKTQNGSSVFVNVYNSVSGLHCDHNKIFRYWLEYIPVVPIASGSF